MTSPFPVATSTSNHSNHSWPSTTTFESFQNLANSHTSNNSFSARAFFQPNQGIIEGGEGLASVSSSSSTSSCGPFGGIQASTTASSENSASSPPHSPSHRPHTSPTSTTTTSTQSSPHTPLRSHDPCGTITSANWNPSEARKAANQDINSMVVHQQQQLHQSTIVTPKTYNGKRRRWHHSGAATDAEFLPGAAVAHHGRPVDPSLAWSAEGATMLALENGDLHNPFHSFDCQSLQRSLKRVRLSASPGELRLQSDLRHLTIKPVASAASHPLLGSQAGGGAPEDFPWQWRQVSDDSWECHSLTSSLQGHSATNSALWESALHPESTPALLAHKYSCHARLERCAVNPLRLVWQVYVLDRTMPLPLQQQHFAGRQRHPTIVWEVLIPRHYPHRAPLVGMQPPWDTSTHRTNIPTAESLVELAASVATASQPSAGPTNPMQTPLHLTLNNQKASPDSPTAAHTGSMDDSNIHNYVPNMDMALQGWSPILRVSHILEYLLHVSIQWKSHHESSETPPLSSFVDASLEEEVVVSGMDHDSSTASTSTTSALVVEQAFAPNRMDVGYHRGGYYYNAFHTREHQYAMMMTHATAVTNHHGGSMDLS